MAVATGTQIRPELSAVDYTPFVQAAAQGAQMQAQGIAAIGAGALKGFESYVQQQKENKQLEAEVKSAEKLGQALQPFLAQVNPEAGAQVNTLLASVADPNTSLRERSAVAKNIGSALNNILNLAQLGKQTQDQKAAAEYAGMLRSGGGTIPSPISSEALSRFTPEQVAAGESAYLQQARSRAELEKTQAETKKLGLPAPTKRLPMVDVLYSSLVDSKTAQLGRELTPKEQSELAIEALRSGQPLPTPEEEATKARLVARAQAEEKSYSELRGSIFSNVPKYTEIMDQNRIAREMIQNAGALQGPASNIKLALMKGVNAVFPNTFDTAPTEVLKKTYKSMALTAASKMKGQGQITNQERQLLEDTITSLGDTEAAAMFFMAFSDAVAARELARADFLSSSEKGGVKPSEGALTADFYRDNPLTNFISDEAKSKISGKKSEQMGRVFGRLDEGTKQGTSPLRTAPRSDVDRANSILEKYKLSPITFGGRPE
jgi:hypothetical protein